MKSLLPNIIKLHRVVEKNLCEKVDAIDKKKLCLTQNFHNPTSFGNVTLIVMEIIELIVDRKTSNVSHWLYQAAFHKIVT